MKLIALSIFLALPQIWVDNVMAADDATMPPSTPTYAPGTSLPAATDSTPAATDTTQTSSSSSAQTPTHNDARTKLNLADEILAAANFITVLQNRMDTSIPSWALAQSKGLIVMHRWSQTPLVGGNGWGVALKKTAPSTFGNLTFYKIIGVNADHQVSLTETDTVALLMSDKSLKTLSDEKLVWGGNLHVIPGLHGPASSTTNKDTDVLIFQLTSPAGAAASVSNVRLQIDDESNRVFNNKPPSGTPGVFNGQIPSLADPGKALIDALNVKPPSPMHGP